jgi:hypothetical protein
MKQNQQNDSYDNIFTVTGNYTGKSSQQELNLAYINMILNAARQNNWSHLLGYWYSKLGSWGDKPDILGLYWQEVSIEFFSFIPIVIVVWRENTRLIPGNDTLNLIACNSQGGFIDSVSFSVSTRLTLDAKMDYKIKLTPDLNSKKIEGIVELCGRWSTENAPSIILSISCNMFAQPHNITMRSLPTRNLISKTEHFVFYQNFLISNTGIELI